MNARIADDERWLARFLIAPAMLYIGAVIGVPFFLAIWFSVSDVTVSSTAGHFVGLDNFRAQLEDPTFRAALGNTFLFAFLSQDPMAFITALVLFIVFQVAVITLTITSPAKGETASNTRCTMGLPATSTRAFGARKRVEEPPARIRAVSKNSRIGSTSAARSDRSRARCGSASRAWR